MSIKQDFYIKEINYKTAEKVVVKCHYAHRKCSCVHAFGLFSKNPVKLRGVIIYGIPASDFVCRCICGDDERQNVYELTRLYIDDGLPRNLESYFIANTIKLLDREIIVSYSDTLYNHVGIVYQASNFIYTGLSHVQRDGATINGKHNRHNKQRVSNGADYVWRSAKHRYIYFNCNKRRRKELMKKLRLPILPYPKQHGSVPITSTENIHDNRRKPLF